MKCSHCCWDRASCSPGELHCHYPMFFSFPNSTLHLSSLLPLKTRGSRSICEASFPYHKTCPRRPGLDHGPQGILTELPWILTFIYVEPQLFHKMYHSILTVKCYTDIIVTDRHSRSYHIVPCNLNYLCYYNET